IVAISQEVEDAVGAEPMGAQTAVLSITDALWPAPNIGAQALNLFGILFFFILTSDDLDASAG
ncbi:AI-2E family transporter, partial [Rhodobacteraceae bacterium]|nr:AI-2E family transporter [Paracoccaceae bacterium]